jgi:frataxin
MARSSASKLARVAYRTLQGTGIPRAALSSIAAAPVVPKSTPTLQATIPNRRFFTGSTARRGITPDGQPPKQTETPKVTKTAADITDDEYHAVADAYMDRLVTRLEELQDEREEVDVEYSVSLASHPPGLLLPRAPLS